MKEIPKGQENILPPEIKCNKNRGNLELIFEEIHWKSKSYPAVELKILFWGQKSPTSIKLYTPTSKQKEKLPLGVLNYKIRTNPALFQSYLRNCDPIHIEIYSLKTNLLIGCSKIKIPLKIQGFLGVEDGVFTKTSGQICNSRNFNLGELIMTIKLEYTEKGFIKPIQNLTLKTTAEKETICTKDLLRIDGVSIRSLANKKKLIEPEFVDVDDVVKDIKKSRKQSILDYLSGQPMDKSDESKILNEIISTSPTRSIIEALDECKPRTAEDRLVELCDSIKIFVRQLELTEAGMLAVERFNRHNEKYLLKCFVVSNLLRSKDDVRVSTAVLDQVEKNFLFNSEVITKIEIPKQRNGKSCNISFNFYHKIVGSKKAYFVANARVNLSEILNSDYSFLKKCPVTDENGLVIGAVVLKLELGSRGVHFGKSLIDAYYCNKENLTVSSDESEPIVQKLDDLQFFREAHKKMTPRLHPSTSNSDNFNDDKNYENKNTQTERKASENSTNNRGDAYQDKNHKDDERMAIDLDKLEPKQEKSRIFHGILVIENMKNMKHEIQSNYFINYDGFWNFCLESTNISSNQVFNYVKEFPVICDDVFLKRVQNNHLELKLWEKTSEVTEKMIAVTKVPLHQFYIAFRDNAMIEHLSNNKLPIISFDGFANFVSPLSNDYFSQVKILLAIGNEKQIEYLKTTRKFDSTPVLPNNPVNFRNNVGVQVNDDRRNSDKSTTKDKLTAFIESLSQKIPEKSVPSVNGLDHVAKNPSVVANGNNVQLRKTSDLLASLQKALSQIPSNNSQQNILSPDPTEELARELGVDSSGSDTPSQTEKFRLLVEVEEAMHLPKVLIKKKRKNRSKNLTNQKCEIEPSSYVTFEAITNITDENKELLPPNITKSHEGYVYTTNVVEKSSNPQWNKSFDIYLDVDIMKNPQKRFVLKVWRKVPKDLPKCRLSPTPLEDAVIGFTAIDLSILLTGIPCLSGWYNILNFSGKCNGQIKLSLKPQENVEVYGQMTSRNLNPLHVPLNIDVDYDNDSSSNLLSRTLKRKFTELEEITQRLKARLFDVTGDENFDPDEEFERDLNTVVDEMEDVECEQAELDNFGWLRKSGSTTDGYPSSHNPNNQESEPQPSTSAGSRSVLDEVQREISGCSNPAPKPTANPMSLESLLSSYDIDTIINPTLFQNILDPTLANSDSTPNLNSNPFADPTKSGAEKDGDETSVSSILSNDHMQSIQNAMQKASINESNKDTDSLSSRPIPEGEHSSSNE